jgi:glutathione S-transferase
MLKLYHAPRTRSVRILWLLEELEIPYQLERVEFLPPAKRFFAQPTPTGKLPTLEDGDVVMCESGAIVEYLVERYGEGRLAPPVGAPDRPAFLQWLHFAESTAFPPLGILVWLTRYRGDAGGQADLIADARDRATTGLDFLERAMKEKRYLLGDAFSAADVMMGFTLVAARVMGVLDDRHPALNAYLDRLATRPAFQKAIAAG